MSQNNQHVRGRVRAPRVQIKYEFETEGAIMMESLPFVLGIIGDFSGDRHREQDPTKRLQPFSKREFRDINVANFNEVLKNVAPTMRLTVENKVQGGSDPKLDVDFEFTNMKDFEPEAIAQKLEPTRQLLELRQKMSNLLNRLEGQTEVDELLQHFIGSLAPVTVSEDKAETVPDAE